MTLRSLIGFIGVGRMGTFMVNNLLKSGARVVVVDSNQDAMNEIHKIGKTLGNPVQVAESPAALALMPGMEAIISMLPHPQAVQDAYLSTNGGLLSVDDHAFHPHILIDSSTVDPVTARQVAEAAEKKLLHPDAAEAHRQLTPYALDCPVSGGVPAAESGTLTFMAGGSEAGVAAAEPVLMAMGKRVVHCGGNGNGQAAKLANNLVLGIQMAAVSEGLEFGRRLGLDPKLLTDVFNSSSAACWASAKYNPVPGVQDGVPSSRGYKGGFTSQLMVKDLNLALESGQHYATPLPMTKLAKSLYQQVTESEKPPPDFSAIYKYVYHEQ